jgi:putative transposase
LKGLPTRFSEEPHFRAEIKHWGIRHSLALVGEPQTNGVIERFWKTFKKQVLEGRVYQTLADLREAVRAWAALYNREWRVGKLKGLSPDEARQAWRQNQAAA